MGCTESVDSYDTRRHLINSITSGKIELVQLLLDGGQIDPSPYSDICLREATQLAKLDIAKLMIQDKRVNPALSRAIYCLLELASLEIQSL